MRPLYRTAFLACLTLTTLSCGGDNPGAPGEAGGVGGPGGPNLTDLSCGEIWTRTVKYHPKGRKLVYESLSSSGIEKKEIVIESSDDVGYTEVTTITRQSNSLEGRSPIEHTETSRDTTTKIQFIKACEKSRSGNSPTVRPQYRRESKITRAGTFSALYLHELDGGTGPNETLIESDTWLNDNPFDTFTIFEKIKVKMPSGTVELTSELVSIVKP